MVQGAYVFGGIGRGVNDLVKGLLEDRRLAEERQREEAQAQSMMMIAQLLMGAQGGQGGVQPPPPGSEQVSGEEAFRPPTPQVSTGAAPGGGSDLDSIFQGLSAGNLGKVKDLPSAQAFLSLIAGLTGQKRSERLEREKADRERKFELEKLGLIGKRQESLEKVRGEEDRKTEGVKRQTKLGEASSQVKGLETALGVPPGTGEQMFPGDPLAALTAGETILGMRGRRGEAPQTPAQKNALRAIAKSIGDRRRKAGLGPLFESEQDLEAALDDPEAFRTLLGRGIGLEMETMGKRFELADYDRRYRLALKRLDLASTKMKLGAKEREEMLSMAAELLSTVKYGELSNITESQVRGQIEKLKKLSKGIPGVDSTGVDAAVDDIETEFFKGGAKEDETPSQRALSPVPQTLSMRKWTQEQWNRYVSSARESGMTVPEIIDQISQSEGLSIMERYSLEVELGMR